MINTGNVVVVCTDFVPRQERSRAHVTGIVATHQVSHAGVAQNGRLFLRQNLKDFLLLIFHALEKMHHCVIGIRSHIHHWLLCTTVIPAYS